MARKQSLLFISPQLPSADNPSAGRTMEVLALLCDQYAVTLACPEAATKLDPATRETLGLHGVMTGMIDTMLAASVQDPLAAKMNHYLSPGKRTRFSDDLKAQIQQRAPDFDLLVFDHFYAFYYQPTGYEGQTIYHAHAAHFADIGAEAGSSNEYKVALEGMRKREIDACASVDHVFVTPEDAIRLADAGVPFGKLQCALVDSRFRTYKSPASDFNSTKPQLVYVGYLGDRDNVRSLRWFIRQVLPQLRATIPGLALHLVGRDPDLDLLTIGMADPHIHFHRSLAEAEMAGESFRVSIDPLLYERGVDTKLVNALARGTPTVTTSAGVARLRGPSPDGITVANSSRDMAQQIRRLLIDKSSWRSLAEGGATYARQHLPTHDMVFRLRQQIGRGRSASLAL